MALNNLGLGFIFTARNLASGTLNRLRTQLGGLGTSSHAAGIAMSAGFAIAAGGVANLIIGVGLLGGALTLAGAAGNFEQQMSLVGRLADASGERLENLRNAAIEAGLATKFSPDEAVEGLRNLITAGLQAEQAAEALTPSLQVAEFGLIDVASAGAAVVGSMNAFRSQGLSAQQIADRLATAMARTNFQAQDFDVGLAAVAGTAGLFNQTLDTTLVGLGLLRNMNIGASRAATGLREAIRRLASDARAQAEAISLIGREGLFKEDGSGIDNILEVMERLRVATQDLSADQRDQKIATILGARGLQLYAAVAGAEFRQTLADGTTQILRGIDAARELERQMENSAGMARQLQAAVSEGNYAGVVNVLKGVGQTMLVELGRPIAEVLIPVVVLLRDSLAALTRFVNRVPLPIKKVMAAFLLLAGVMFTGAGIVGILTGVIVMLIPFLKAIAIGFLIALAAMGPFIVGVSAVIGAIVLLRQAVRLNVGGIAKFFEQAYNRVRLVFQALTQLFTQGGFSGEVRDEMNRAENQGIRQFVINIFRIWGRIREFFRGVQIGFSRVALALGPTFEALKTALTELARAFGFVQDGVGGLADTDMDSWAETGARVGGILADVLERIVVGITVFATIWARTIEFFRTAWKQIGPIFTFIGEKIGELAEEFEAMFQEMGLFSPQADRMTTAGEIIGGALSLVAAAIGGVIVGIVQFVRGIVWLVRTSMRASAIIGDFFTRMSIRVQTTFQNMVDAIRNALDRVIAMVGGIVQKIPPGIRTVGMDDIISAGTDAESRIAGRNRAIAERSQVAEQRISTEGTARTRAFEAAAQARAEARDRQMASVMEAIRTERERDRAEATRPINVSIDGEVVASAVDRANRRAGARGFTPVPANSD